MRKPIGLYVHIPFCASKCPYCDFYSVGYRTSLEREYVAALLCQMERYRGRGITADTLYFGGGTPSLIRAESIARIVDTARAVFALDSAGEITLEANPCTVTDSKVRDYARMGINRVSLGMQSFDARELEALGRRHNLTQTQTAVERLRDGGISNLSLDLMLATPYQTAESLAVSLDFLRRIDVPHVSAYLLKVEPNTPYASDPITKFCPDDDTACDFYLSTVELLKTCGIFQYEISNFAKSGFESRHNLKYWNSEEYLGFGCAAHSLFDQKRFFVPRNIEDYLLHSGSNTVEEDDDVRSFTEYAMLRLRLTAGLDLDQTPYPHTDFSQILRRAQPLQENGLLSIRQNNLSLTPKGFLVSNSVIAALLL